MNGVPHQKRKASSGITFQFMENSSATGISIMLEEKPKKRSKKRKSLLLIFKLFSALAIGIFMAMIGQALINYSYFSFMFIFLTVFLSFWTLVKKKDFLTILLVDLFFIFLLLIVRVYIVISDSG